MAQEKPNRFVEWLLIARENYPVLRRRLSAWWEAVREEPALIWRSRGIRYAVYSFALIILLWVNQTFPLAHCAEAHRALEARDTTGSTVFQI